MKRAIEVAAAGSHNRLSWKKSNTPVRQSKRVIMYSCLPLGTLGAEGPLARSKALENGLPAVRRRGRGTGRICCWKFSFIVHHPAHETPLRGGDVRWGRGPSTRPRNGRPPSGDRPHVPSGAEQNHHGGRQGWNARTPFFPCGAHQGIRHEDWEPAGYHLRDPQLLAQGMGRSGLWNPDGPMGHPDSIFCSSGLNIDQHPALTRKPNSPTGPFGLSYKKKKNELLA